MTLRKNARTEGIVKKIITGRSGTMVELETPAGQSITANIATAAAYHMGLKAGMLVAAAAIGRSIVISIIS